jgi:hypothetical protein
LDTEAIDFPMRKRLLLIPLTFVYCKLFLRFPGRGFLLYCFALHGVRVLFDLTHAPLCSIALSGGSLLFVSWKTGLASGLKTVYDL